MLAARRRRTYGTVRNPALSETRGPSAPDEMRQPQQTQPRSHGPPPSLGPSPVQSQPHQLPEPKIPTRRCRERSRQSRSPRRAPLRRIRLGMPNALLLAVADQYPKALGLRGTTHPREVPLAVHGWLGADHRTGHACFLIALTISFRPATLRGYISGICQVRPSSRLRVIRAVSTASIKHRNTWRIRTDEGASAARHILFVSCRSSWR